MPYFKKYQPDEIKKRIKIRENETKLGEKIHIGNFNGQYIIVGIPESVGVKANQGIGGTETLWDAFLSVFLNIQSTENLSGQNISILGYFDFTPPSVKTAINTEIIDKSVEKIISEIAEKGKIPIVIGGGHNNAYPILKGISKVKKQAINTINLDAHTDFRLQEGRHSGNGFRYAYAEGFLIGLHENYNAANIIHEISENRDIDFTFYEDIFIREKLSFKEAINRAINFTKDTDTGVELDLDCIENTLSSALTPCGISTLQARQYLHHTAKNCAIAYLHIAEGATQLDTGLSNPLTAKLVTYLVCDFLKAHQGR
jgi:formiminoglutamase